MKKTLSLISGLLVAATMFGAEVKDQLTLAMSTPGPDTYADGSPVLAGETYLLVYVKQGAVFGGVQTDGSLVDPLNNVIVTSGQAVEGAKCGYKAIQYPAATYPEGGSWVIVVLDTRKSDGTLGGLVAAQGVSGANGAVSALSLGAAGGTTAAGLSAAGPAPSPAGTPPPVIAAVQAGGGSVSLSIKNFSDTAIYQVQSATSLNGGWQTVASRVQATTQSIVQGDSGAELRTDFSVPPADTVRFFKVIAQ
jgi:hypothetical protein